jgi:azurin
MTRALIVALAASTALWTATPSAQGSAPAAKPAAAAQSGARTITITATESPTPKFDVTKITAKPGETLHIVLKAVGTMPKMAMSHNWVLLKAGTTEKQESDFASEAALAAQTAYIPAAKKAMVVAHTPTAVGAGETTEVTFKVPAAAGTYPFLCSFPGHYAMGMKGTLTVAK